MCGIAGFTSRNDPELMGQMLTAIEHRGPDDGGAYFSANPEVSLGMRRLTILDLAGGKQPMDSKDGSCTIVFNGEIFNASDLRRDLESSGVQLKSRNSDTEVLLELYAQHGPGIAKRLNGMFAFVIHDRKRGILYGARDPFGIKPFYYSQPKDQSFVFSSELKSLLQDKTVALNIRPNGLAHYLGLQIVPAPETIIEGVEKLPAGHEFIFQLEQRALSVHKFWTPPLSQSKSHFTEEQWIEKIRTMLPEALGRWVQSDFPIALSLSGGLDSSIITALCAQMKLQKELHTFSIVFPNHSELDESQGALSISRKWKTTHHEIKITPEDVINNLEDMVSTLDEPYSGGLPSWFLYKEMTKHARVALSGTGADELFGNYGKWIPHEQPFRRLKRTMKHLMRGQSMRGLTKNSFASLYPVNFIDAEKETLLSSQLRNRVTEWTEDFIEHHADTHNHKTYDARDRVAELDLSVQLPEEFLHVTDRFAMRFSIEARTPFLDMDFAQMVLSIPSAQRTSAKNLKFLLREAFRPLLTEPVLNAPKRGFVLPIAQWARKELQPMVEEYLSKRNLELHGFFNQNKVRQLIKKTDLGNVTAAEQLWNVLMFQIWYMKVFRGRLSNSPSGGLLH